MPNLIDLKSSYTVESVSYGTQIDSVSISSGIKIITVDAVAGSGTIPVNFGILKDSSSLNGNNGALCIYLGNRSPIAARYYLTISNTSFTATYIFPIIAH